MLDIKKIQNNPELYREKLSQRNFDLTKFDELISLFDERKEFQTKIQELEAKRNDLSKQIGKVKSEGGDVQSILDEVSAIKNQIQDMNENSDVLNKIEEILLGIPNITRDDVPVGKDEEENVVLSKHDQIGRGEISVPKSHFDIGVEKGIIDFERSVRMSGTRFWSYIGKGARLIRALENFMLDEHAKRGYQEFRVPVLVNSQTMQGTGQLPKFADDLFKIEGRDLWLIPTAEVPLTNFYQDEIIDLNEPKKFTAFTPCFRAEAGSGGKDMKGLIRAHQFNKIELVKLVKEEQVESEFNELLESSKNILEKLELPYQELQLCTGDTGFSSEKTIDLEVWIPSESRYREISSVSTFGDFQGRRAKIRYKDENGKNKTAFTINGSGLALDRTMAAVLENYQNEDGTITVPEVLKKYLDFETI